MVDLVPLTGMLGGDQNTVYGANQLLTTGADGSITVSSNLTASSSGNVGIGTSNPQYLFSVYGTDTVLFNNAPTGGNRREIIVGNSSTSGAVLGFDVDGTVPFGYVRSVASGANTSAVSWTSTGNVGIGNVAAPSSALDVAGKITVSAVNTNAGVASHLLLKNMGGTSTTTAYTFNTGVVALQRVDSQGNIYQNSDVNSFYFNADSGANATAGTANFYTTVPFMQVVGNAVTIPGTLSFGSQGSLTFGNGTINSSTGNISLLQPLNTQGILENVNIQTSAPTSTVNFDFLTSSILYYNTPPTANMILNIRGNSTVALNTVMSSGQSINCTVVLTNSASTTYYISTITIDGATVVPKYIGAVTPTTGYASGVDVYSLAIIKTSAFAYQVLVAQSHYG